MKQEFFTIDDLRNWPKAMAPGEKPVRLGVIGDPVAHSLSPVIQNAGLEAAGVAARYARFHIHSSHLAESLTLAREQKFIGINLTLPHKVAAVPLLHKVDANAAKIGAVNTVSFRDGTLMGDNTDGIGFARAFAADFGIGLRGLRVLILGAGGAARALARQCQIEDCRALSIVARSLAKARRLAVDLSEESLEIEAADLRSLPALSENIDVIVNATPVGLARGDTSLLSSEHLRRELMVFDTIPLDETPLLQAAKRAGARYCGGKEMLLQQGAAAFALWFGRSAPLREMRAALTEGDKVYG
ncbi:MAG: shikimate dehydrogenase [Verrucomicrobiota bacterium]